MTRQRQLILVGIVVVLGVVGFLLFRPDTLFTDIEVEESLGEAFTDTTLSGSVTTIQPDPGTTTPNTGTTPSIAVVSSGGFYGIDHRAAGTATVYQSDGRYVLRFEDDTDIQNGPDLYVWLLAADDYDAGPPDEYIDLGKLKGNLGGQNYQLPEGFDPEVHRSVLIWCLRFAVPFAAAPLSPG